MVKHVILWKFKGMEKPEEQMALIKENLEGLGGQIPGISEIKVTLGALETSSSDAMLEVFCDDFETLKGYAKHPAHVNVAETYIRPYIETRLAFDFEM